MFLLFTSRKHVDVTEYRQMEQMREGKGSNPDCEKRDKTKSNILVFLKFVLTYTHSYNHMKRETNVSY